MLVIVVVFVVLVVVLIVVVVMVVVLLLRLLVLLVLVLLLPLLLQLLQRDYPNDYDALCKSTVTFGKKSDESDLRAERSTLQVDPAGGLRRITFDEQVLIWWWWWWCLSCKYLDSLVRATPLTKCCSYYDYTSLVGVV